MIGYVFEENSDRLDFLDDPDNVRPEVSRILRSTLATGHAERLTWIASHDEIHSAAPRRAIEGS
jgi:hypothetical protein